MNSSTSQAPLPPQELRERTDDRVPHGREAPLLDARRARGLADDEPGQHRRQSE
jgi:hypothetical protein